MGGGATVVFIIMIILAFGVGYLIKKNAELRNKK